MWEINELINNSSHWNRSSNADAQDLHLNSTVTGSCDNTGAISRKDGIVHVGVMTAKFF